MLEFLVMSNIKRLLPPYFLYMKQCVVRCMKRCMKLCIVRSVVLGMKRCIVRCVVLGMVLGMVPITGLAGCGARKHTPTVPISKTPSVSYDRASLFKKDSSGVLFISRKVHLRFDKLGRARRTMHRRYRLMTPQAVDAWTFVDIPWSPWLEHKPKIDIKVTTPDGVSHGVDERNIAVVPVSSSHSPRVLTNRRSLRIPLPALCVGAELSIKVIIKEKKTAIPSGSAHRFALAPGRPTLHSKLLVDAPKSLRLHFAMSGVKELKKTTERQGSRNRWVFEAGPFRRDLEIEPELSPHQPRQPTILVSSVPSWQAAARDYANIVNKALQRETTTPPRFPPGVADVRDKAAFLLASVRQRVRYVSLALDERAIVPKSPQKTLKEGFGDCKDMSTLLVAWLRREGLKAHVALVKSANSMDVHPQIPGVNEFDHAIVYVDTSPPLWIDPAAQFTRVGELAPNIEGRRALVASEMSTGLTPLPKTKAQDNVLEIRRIMEPAQAGRGRIRERITSRGSPEFSIRYFYWGEKKEFYDEKMRAHGKTTLKSEKVKTLERTACTDLTRPFSYGVIAEESGLLVTSEKDVTVTLPMTNVLSLLPPFLIHTFGNKDRKKRRNPLWFSPPHITQMHYEVLLPIGFVVDKLPPNKTIDMGPARITMSFVKAKTSVQHPGRIRVICRFQLSSGKRMYSAAETEQMFDGLSRLAKEPASIQITFPHRGFQLVDKGQFKEALEYFRVLATKHPKQPIHRRRYAAALLQMGFAEKAQVFARQAARENPNCLETQLIEGWVLEHNHLGLHLAVGFKRKEAIEAYKRARKLRPNDASVRLALARLYTTDDKGVTHEKRGELEQAVKEYLTAYRLDKDSVSKQELLIVLLLNGSYKQANKLFEDEMQADKHSDKHSDKQARTELVEKVFQLMTLMLYKGPAATERLAGETASSPQEKRFLLRTTSVSLKYLRRYTAAKALLERIRPLEPEEKELLNKLQRYKKHEKRRYDNTKPKGFALRALLDHLTKRFPEKHFIKTYFHPDLDEKAAIVSLRALSYLGHLLGGKSTSNPGTFEAQLDHFLGHIKVRVSEDGTGEGFRVQVFSSENPSTPFLTFFILKSSKGLRIWSINNNTEVATRALNLLSTNKKQGAAIWLNWARYNRKILAENDSRDPVLHLWNENESPTKERIMATAGCLLLGRKDTAQEALQALKAVRLNSLPESLRVHALHCKATAYKTAGKKDQARNLLTRASRRYHRNVDIFRDSGAMLLDSGRLPATRKLIEKRLSLFPNDYWALYLLAQFHMKSGNVTDAIKSLSRIISGSKTDYRAFNQIAWYRIFASPPDLETAKKEGEKSVKMAKGSSASALHTLATIYSLRGELRKSHDTLLQCIQKNSPMKQKRSLCDWLVYGIIAEKSGFVKTAIETYERLEKEGKQSPTSCRSIGIRRLKDLRKK